MEHIPSHGETHKVEVAVVGIDTNGDGYIDAVCMGVDKDGDGIPDNAQKAGGFAGLVRQTTQTEKDRMQQAIHQKLEDELGHLQPIGKRSTLEMLRYKAHQIVKNPLFEGFILSLILINSILLALYQYRDPGCTFNKVSDDVIDPILLAFFTIESVLKILAWGLVCPVIKDGIQPAYLRDAWNWLDFVVVVTGWIMLFASGDGFGFLRVFRVLRPLRSLTMLREMRLLVNTVIESISGLLNVTLMAVFIFMVFAIIGITLWGGIFYRQCRSTPAPTLSWAKDCWFWNASNPDDPRLCGGMHTCFSGSWCGGHPKDLEKEYRPLFNGSEDGHLGLPWCDSMDLKSAWTGEYMRTIDEPRKVFPETDFIHFDHIGGALLIVFQSMTMEGWVDIMYMVQDGDGNLMATIYFFMVILITSFFVLNVILAVIAENLIANEKEENEEEIKRTSQLAEDTLAEEILQRLADREAQDSPMMVGDMVRVTTDADSMKKASDTIPEFCWDDCMNGILGKECEVKDVVEMSGNTFVALEVPTNAYSKDGKWLDAKCPCNTSADGTRTWPYPVELLTRLPPPTQDQPQPFWARYISFLLPQKKAPAPAPEPLAWSAQDSCVSAPAHQFMGTRGVLEDVWFDSKVVRVCCAIVDHEAFRCAILVTIGANVAVMMLDKFPPDLALKHFTDACETFFLTVFAIEMVMTICAMGPTRYIKTPLTCFDGIIVCSSFLELLLAGGSALSIFRSFRLLRVVFKIAKKWEDFRVLLKSIIKTMTSLGYFALLFLLVMYVLTLMGMSFFATEFHFTDDLAGKVQEDDDAVWCPEPGGKLDCIPRANFDTFVWAFTTVFQIMSGENWNTVMYDGMRTGKVIVATGYFVFMIVFGQIMMLNLFLTILMENFDNAQKELKEEEKAKSEMRKSKRKHEMEEYKGFHEEFSESRTKTGFDRTEEDEEVVETTAKMPMPNAQEKKQATLVACALAIAESIQDKKFSHDLRSTAGGSCGTLEEPGLQVEHLPGQVPPVPPPGSSEDIPSALNDVASEVRAAKVTASAQPREDIPKAEQAKLGDASSRKVVSYEETANDKQQLLAVDDEILDSGNSARSINPEPTSLNDEWPRTYALLIFSRQNPMRQICRKIVSRKEFEHFILTCILLSSTIMAIDSPLRDPGETFTKFLHICDRVFAIIFIIEMAMRVTALGLCLGHGAYLKNAWNWIDAVVVVVSIIDMTGLTESLAFLKTLRILRAFRALSFINKNENLKVVVTTLLESLPELATLFSVAMLFLLIFALLFLAYLNGKFYGCTDGGDNIAMSRNMGDNFVTPLCLAPASNQGVSVCQRGSYDGENQWTSGTCSTCSTQTITWQRPGADTPICVGRCSPLHGPLLGPDAEAPEAICPKKLTKVEELPSVCPHGELNLQTPTAQYFVEEQRGINYVNAMLQDHVLPCAGPVAGAGCRDLFCPQKIGQPTSESCKEECRIHPTFCVSECNKDQSDWENNKSPACVECTVECEGWCECQDYCEPLAKDAALCVEQGERWGMTISQNFNTIMNAMTTLFEISTTEGWVDVMYEAVDAIDYYVQPKRDYNLVWAFAFIVYIFFANMFIINLSVGVIVDNFLQLKLAAKQVNADGVKVQTAPDGSKYCGRPLAAVAAAQAGMDSQNSAKSLSQVFGRGKSSADHDVCRPEFQCQACSEYKEPCLTDKQAEWVEYQKGLFWMTEPFELTNLHLKPPSQKKLFFLISSPTFEHTIMTIIILNTLLMACNVFPAPTKWWSGFLEGAGYIFACIFTMEFGLKFYALRSKYWKDSWNDFDFFCVVATLAGIIINAATSANIGTLMSVIRIFRVARLFRLLRFFKGVNKIFMALVCSLPKLANVSILLVLLLILYSILGVQMFAKVKFADTLNVHGNFQDFPTAFTTLFRSMTGEAWNEIMHDLDKDEKDAILGPRISDPKSWCSPPSLFDTDKESSFKVLKDKCLIEYPNQCREYAYTSQLYYVSFCFVITFSVLNLVIAVILEGYSDGQQHCESEVIDTCRRLWRKYDPDYTLFIDAADAFLYADEVMHEQGLKVADTELLVPRIRPSPSAAFGMDLASVPLKYAQALDLALTDDGKVHFHVIVKMVLRILVTENDPENLQELEETFEKLSPSDAKRLRELEQTVQKRNNLTECIERNESMGLKVQVAASKIQRKFKAKKAQERALGEIERRLSSGNLKDDAATSSLKAESVATDDLPGPPQFIGATASGNRGVEDSGRVLLPRNPANVDGLDEPGRWGSSCVVQSSSLPTKQESASLLRSADQANDVVVLDPPPGG